MSAFLADRPVLASAATALALLLTFLLAPEPTRATPSLDRPPEAAPERGAKKGQQKAQRIEKQIRGCTNRRRIKQGLRPLAPAKPLGQAAGLLAENMREFGFFDHIDQRGRDVADRVGIFAPKSRYLPIGENIGAGYEGARGVCKAWMSSEGHRANILNPAYTVIGAGYADGGKFGTYYVQVFGRGPRR